jgi:hypothetical protein
MKLSESAFAPGCALVCATMFTYMPFPLSWIYPDAKQLSAGTRLRLICYELSASGRTPHWD